MTPRQRVFNFQDMKTSIQVQIWDSSGSQSMAPDMRILYEKCDIAFLMYDITNSESFEKLKGWMGDLMEYQKREYRNISRVVLGNKLDLNEVRAVEWEEAEKMALEMDCLFGEVSCKENIGVRKTFQDMIGEFAKDLDRRRKVEENWVTYTSDVESVDCAVYVQMKPLNSMIEEVDFYGETWVNLLSSDRFCLPTQVDPTEMTKLQKLMKKRRKRRCFLCFFIE